MIKRLVIFCLCLVTSVKAQELVGGEFVLSDAQSASVQNAVQTLGNEVLKSNFAYAVDKMYPRWKTRQAKRLGSEQKLLEKFNAAGAQMTAAGITIDAFRAKPPTLAFRVFPKLKEGKTSIQSDKDLVYELLVIVPTVKKLTIFPPNEPKRVLSQQSFQIAIAKEGSNTWTFIDGATLKAQDLHSMFPLLPQDLKLPEKHYQEIK